MEIGRVTYTPPDFPTGTAWYLTVDAFGGAESDTNICPESTERLEQ